jgi:chemotaxis signal transduction protein
METGDLFSKQDLEVELVLFEVAGHRFGADAFDVEQVVSSPRQETRTSPLGLASRSGRSLVVRGAEGARVPIDRLHGFERAGARELRRVPEFVRGLALPALVGFYFSQEKIWLLIDLEALVKEDHHGREPKRPRQQPSELL